MKRTNKRALKPNGYVLHETADIVVIATGFRRKSANPKTGDMLQVWILARAVNPVRAVKIGKDSINCLDCALRGNKGKGRTCYVRVANAPLGVWKAYRRGNYPFLPMADYAAAFEGRRARRKVRFGAYGEPVLIPLAVLAELARVSDGWTGYTHQWRNPEYAGYKAFIMASVDSEREQYTAKAQQWRTFRVRTADSAHVGNEISCPASDEAGKRTTCADCKLCNGTYDGDGRRDIVIIAHGAGARKFELIQIGAKS